MVNTAPNAETVWHMCCDLIVEFYNLRKEFYILEYITFLLGVECVQNDAVMPGF